ncbi:MAG: hypothetical protein ACTHN5_02165 [Phycisphaerae bacterium]
MRRQVLSVLAVPLLLTGAALAQNAPDQGPTADQQELQQMAQEMRQKVMDNILKQGLDPAAVMQDIMQRMQDGSLNFSQLQQELVDKGLLDQASVDKLQEKMTKVTDATLKQQLKATDEEWAVIQPKIHKVLAAQAAAGQGMAGGQRFGGMMGGFVTGQNGQASVALALTKLRMALHTKAPDDVVKERLQAVRDARAQAKADLTAAENDLRDVLTVWQEGVLVRVGIMP